MEYTLLGLGIVCLVLGFFAIEKENQPVNVEEIKVFNQGLTQSQRDLEVLLGQLDKASEAAVNQLEDKISEALALVEEYDRLNKRIQKVYSIPTVKNQNQSEPASLEEASEVTSGPAVDKRQVIYKMAEAGLSIDQIAKEAQIGKGEVTLILEMKNRGARK